MSAGLNDPPGGRPTKYLPEFCEQCIEFMGLGYSLTAFAGKIGVSRATVTTWLKEWPEFGEAAAIGQASRTMKLEETLLAGESGPKVQGHIFALKNAAPDDWKDKREVAPPDGGFRLTISQDDANL